MKPGLPTKADDAWYADFEDADAVLQAQPNGSPRPISDPPARRSGVRRSSAIHRDKAAWFSGVDLLTRPEVPTLWLPFLGQPEYMEQSATNLLVATFKAGKTTLLTQCMWDWLEANHPVLMISEESAVQWTRRLQGFAGTTQYDELGYYTGEDRLYLGDNGPLSNLMVFPAMGWTARDIEAKLHTLEDGIRDTWGIYAGEYLAGLVVILDTTKLLNIVDENESGVMNAALTPFVTFQQASNCTMIIVHHTRKGDGKDGEEIAGSHLTGAKVDNLITIRREPNDKTRRSVHARGRFVSEKTGLYEGVEVVNDHGVATGRFMLRWVGEKVVQSVAAVKDRLKALILRDSWLTTAEIIEGLAEPKPSRDTVTKSLEELCEEGYAERKPKFGKPAERQTVRWKRAD